MEYQSAYNLAGLLVSKGYIIVSGLAKWIDEAAHKGTLDARGQTIAIVNTPIEQPIYPYQNRELAERIKENGCIIHPFIGECRENKDEKPTHFTKRLLERDWLVAYLNPVIVAVSDNEVIEGGARYAVNYGKEFGKKVFRYDSKGEFHENPKNKYCKIGWNMEMDVDEVINKLNIK